MFFFPCLQHVIEALLDIQLYLYVFNRYRHKGNIICHLFPSFRDALMYNNNMNLKLVSAVSLGTSDSCTISFAASESVRS